MTLSFPDTQTHIPTRRHLLPAELRVTASWNWGRRVLLVCSLGFDDSFKYTRGFSAGLLMLTEQPLRIKGIAFVLPSVFCCQSFAAKLSAFALVRIGLLLMYKPDS